MSGLATRGPKMLCECISCGERCEVLDEDEACPNCGNWESLIVLESADE